MSENPIGIFDSGLGGLTVAAAIARLLPHENLVYLGDTARVPYGTKSGATVVKYAQSNLKFLANHRVKATVVACNTVSAQGIKSFGGNSEQILIGVIQPGAERALSVSKTKRIAVLATPATVTSNAYPNAIQERDRNAYVVSISCPLLVPLAEEGWTDHEATELIVSTYLSELEGHNVDTIILGCTHYPLLEACITRVAKKRLGEHIQVINSADVVAQRVKAVLIQHQLINEEKGGHRAFFATDVSGRSQDVANLFWQRFESTVPVFQHVDITPTRS